MQAIRPEVVGHFDLIRLHDAHYQQTLVRTEVWDRVLRNLEWMAKAGAVLDVNARALLKGQTEPYVCAPILDAAARLGVGVAYGDDAHGVADVGCGFARVAVLLAGRGMNGPEASSCERLKRLVG
jgi:histidinol-phosphatase (PHP family)